MSPVDQLNNVATENGYTAATTLEAQGAGSFNISVHNASIYYQRGHGVGVPVWELEERFLPPAFHPREGGDWIRVRSATPGVSARVTVEPGPEGGAGGSQPHSITLDSASRAVAVYAEAPVTADFDLFGPPVNTFSQVPFGYVFPEDGTYDLLLVLDVDTSTGTWTGEFQLRLNGTAIPPTIGFTAVAHEMSPWADFITADAGDALTLWAKRTSGIGTSVLKATTSQAHIRKLGLEAEGLPAIPPHSHPVGDITGLGGEAWHPVGGAGEPPFENGWVNYDSAAHFPLSFKKDPLGVVRLRGAVKNGSAPTAVIFTLPAGYRPSKRMGLICESAVPNFSGVVRIEANGQVYFAGNGAVTYEALDGIAFEAT